jgi:hypothetical protein
VIGVWRKLSGTYLIYGYALISHQGNGHALLPRPHGADLPPRQHAAVPAPAGVQETFTLARVVYLEQFKARYAGIYTELSQAVPLREQTAC